MKEHAGFIADAKQNQRQLLLRRPNSLDGYQGKTSKDRMRERFVECVISSWTFFWLAVLVVSDSWWPHGLEPTRLPCSWNFPGKNTGVGCHFLLQGFFPTQGSKPHLLNLLPWPADSSPLVPPGKVVFNWESISSTFCFQLAFGLLASSQHKINFSHLVGISISVKHVMILSIAPEDIFVSGFFLLGKELWFY